MKKKSKEEINSEVDVHDDKLMISLGIRAPHYIEPDFTKTKQEKALLKKVRTKNDMKYSGLGLYKRPSTCYAKLIVYIEPIDGTNDTTFSCMCYQHQINSIIKTMYPTFVKYYFNGTTYFALQG